ncbi:hypothetical protein WBP06_10575 [Novosphingobium sp. BL-8H]|uniref:hypothetical protein n=1 Tax=Novosphingobium sp. BL-8H TaxID=3127640 RepID=UPI0037580AA6
MKISDYEISETHRLPNGRSLILFASHPKDGVVCEDILGKEICLFDDNRCLLWKIDPEPGSTVGHDRTFDRSSTVVFDFVHISHEGGLYFAEKYNGDVFEMDIDNGSAKFAFWKKT